MVPSFFSLASLYSRYLCRCFASAGLNRHAIDVDDETTMAFWGPKPCADQTARKFPIILLHGFGPVAILQWKHQVEFLTSEFDVYVPDLVFFGDSTTRSSERTEVFQAVSVGKLAEKLGLKKFSVIGTSYGGMVSYHVARLFPERVEKVIIASSGINNRQKDSEELLKRAKVEKIEDLLLPATANQLRRLLAFVAHNRTPAIIPDFFFNDFVNTFYSKNRAEKRELLKGVTVGRESSAIVSPLHQEVLIIWGEQDNIFPVEKAAELAKLIGGKARLEVIEKSGHIPQMECPRQFNEMVKKFLIAS